MSKENPKDKELKVSEEIHDLFMEYDVCIKCRDQAIESMFRAKRAISYGKDAEKALDKAWKFVKELYPRQYNDRNIYYSFTDKALYERAKNEKNKKV